MTTITFETATIADAIKRAVKVAPGKSGHAFDKAAGVLLEIDPENDACMIRTTNLDAFHAEVVGVLFSEGEPDRWRLPSQLLGNVVGSLPPKAGAEVTFTREGNTITIRQGRMKSTMRVMDDDSYPDWELFDNSNLTQVAALGQRISMVEWAAEPSGTPPLCGVYLDGEWAVATDRYKVVRVPCKIENMPKPVLVPSGILGQTLRAMGETSVGYSGHQFLLAPDNYTWLTTTVYDADWPDLSKIYNFEYDGQVQINKADFIEKLGRSSNYAGADRNPLLRTFWGKGEIALMMENTEVGLFGDVIEMPGSLDHRRLEILFTPKLLLDCLNNAPDQKVTVHYDIAENDPVTRPTIRIDGGAGYQAWVMKRRPAQNV